MGDNCSKGVQMVKGKVNFEIFLCLMLMSCTVMGIVMGWKTHVDVTQI